MSKRCWIGVLAAVALSVSALHGQDYGARLGTVKRGGKVSFEPTGPGVLMDALDPTVRKWYVPQELYAEYSWKQWEYSNYARENYQRYVSTALEGDYLYDVFGNYLTRGWLVYDWRQESPQPFGSTVEKTSQFTGWFSSLAIASDHKGQYHYSITVGNQIRTTLTPMTFSKPLFNGLQLDFASDKHMATLLMSRISSPSSLNYQPEQRTNNTNLFGGRLVTQVGDFVKIGGTLINVHHSQTQRQAVNGDIFKGQLTEAMNFSPLTEIQVRIRDDSPGDGKGGGALFSSDIVIYDLEGNAVRGSDIGFRPLTEGGFQRQGFLAADGLEEILIRYDFADRTYIGTDPTEITRVEIELVVANDYLIEVTSSNQIDAGDRAVFLPVAQARGNITDGSNQRVLRFDYGLPTANQIAGFTFELMDVAGTRGYFEMNVNQRHRRYPNPNIDNHHAATDESRAWLGNISHQRYPFFAFGEFFSVSPAYNTSFVTADGEGVLDYENQYERYEFVDDNDDQDRRPDWRRKSWGPGDEDIFPGWDENNDFISDFNQNDNDDHPNLIPDYEEPFLRYYADRPEFLYGVDMNHNGWIDRFENDEEADLPYQKDREGYNLFGGVFIDPETRLMLGRIDIRQLSNEGGNRAHYGLFTLDKEGVRWGRLRIFQDLRRVWDDIPDDLLQWEQQPNTRGSLQLVHDPLPARNTWINSTWIGWEQHFLSGLTLAHRFKWQLYHQLDDRIDLELRGIRRDGSFLGLINKGEYLFNVGNWTFGPRWKSEFRKEAPVRRELPKRKELSELFLLVSRFPVMYSSFIETGVEYEVFSQLLSPTPPGAEDSFRGLTTTIQLSNVSDYQGYRLNTIMGFQLTRINPEAARSEVTTRSFITIYAGVER
jgi:hypothetical protein